MTNPELDMLAAKIAERLTTPRWLKLRQAVQYAGMGKTCLLKLLRSGDIAGYQNTDKGNWIIDRESIDQYHTGNMQAPKEVVADLLESFI